MLGACSIPEGDQSSPSQLHYLWLKVRADGDVDRMWALLHPDTRKELESWLAAERAVVREIKASYPAEDAIAALKVVGGDRGELESARDLFVTIVTPAPATPSTLGAVGARVRSEEIAADGTSATVRTFGGDEVVFRKGPGDQWFVTLQSDEAVRLRNARTRAEENLRRVRANLQKLRRNKP
jgi:hypothetical protein